jgi:hypothetical protein
LPCITRESKRKYEMTHRQANIFMEDNAEERRGEERRGQAEPERLVANPSESLHGFDGGFFVDVKKKRRCNEVPVLDL